MSSVWSEDKINAAVEEIIRKLVTNPKFEEEIRKHIGSSIDTQELDREHTGLQDKISEENVYNFLLFFDKLYDKFTDIEKKT